MARTRASLQDAEAARTALVGFLTF